MNLKDYVLNYLNNERKHLERQINHYQKIKIDESSDSEGRKELIDRMVESHRHDYNSYLLNLKYDFIQSRSSLMLDLVCCNKEFYPGSKSNAKYSESRAILKQISFATFREDSKIATDCKITEGSILLLWRRE